MIQRSLKRSTTVRDYGEERIQALGKTGGFFYLVVYTWRDETRHIITA